MSNINILWVRYVYYLLYNWCIACINLNDKWCPWWSQHRTTWKILSGKVGIPRLTLGIIRAADASSNNDRKAFVDKIDDLNTPLPHLPSLKNGRHFADDIFRCMFWNANRMTSSNGNIFRVTGPLGQWRGALMFSLICAWINGWVNNREAGDLRRHRTHYDVTVTLISHDKQQQKN